MKISVLIFCLLALAIVNPINSATIKNPLTPLKDEPSAKKYRLIVSFASKGEGINLEKQTEFLDFVSKYKNKPSYVTILWGREGETDYCFELKELSKKETKKFIQKIRQLFLGKELIFVEENKSCLHQGRS